jgi:hypothetical protein
MDTGMKHAQFPALFKKYETQDDKGLKMYFYSRELTPQEKNVIDLFIHNECYLTISADPFTGEVPLPIEPPPAPTKTGRSQSQLQRDCYYVLWNILRRVQPQTTTDDFNAFYQMRMGESIGAIKREIRQYD